MVSSNDATLKKKRERFATLEDFSKSIGSKSRIWKGDPNQLEIDIFAPRCPRCGGQNVVKRGLRLRKLKGEVQLYCCKNCGRRFPEEPNVQSHFPMWVIDIALKDALERKTYKDVAEAIENEARRRNENLSISRQTIPNLIRRYVKLLLDFEENSRHGLSCPEWEIDDSFQTFPKKRQIAGSDVKYGRKSENFRYITNVLACESRYWLAAYVSSERDVKASEKALRLALKRSKYAPQKIKCDGFKPHRKAISNVFRHTHIESKAKKEDFGWINKIERLHVTMRKMGIKKRRFRSEENLRNHLDLGRLYYNFLRPHQALNGDTPARKAGITHANVRTWSEFVTCAYRQLKKRPIWL